MEKSDIRKPGLLFSALTSMLLHYTCSSSLIRACVHEHTVRFFRGWEVNL